jgi:hypothetical protein
VQTVKGYLRITGFVLIVFAGFSLISCLPGTRIARKYIRQKEKESIFLLSPEYLYKENLNSSAIPGFRSLDSLEKDSALFFNSCLIQYLDDSMVLRAFYEAMADALKAHGYKVYTDAGMSDFFLQEKAWVISIAQQEFQEYSYPYYPMGFYEDTIVYAAAIEVNGISLNTWFEVSRVNDTLPFQVLFNPTIFEDTILGDFYWNPFTDEYPYFYSRSDIQLELVKDLAAKSGRTNAGLFVDYMMNLYVNSHRRKKISKDYYLHYNTRKNKFHLAKKDRLIPLDP